MNQKINTLSFVAIVSLFFMWGFITCLNDILIPQLKSLFELNRASSMFVQFCFFGAYFIGSLVYFLISIFHGDPVSKFGYKKGIIAGLTVAAIGCFLFYPASVLKLYPIFLTGLFVLGIGLTLLQITANPYVTILGKPETASGRLNLSQAFNSLGTTLAPMIGGILMFKMFDTSNIHIPYLIFAAVFLVMAIIILFVPLPSFQNSELPERGFGALKHKNLVLGFFAIFCYVGAEVSIGSSFINFAKELLPSLSEQSAANYLAFYWGGLMIGRFLGSLSLIPFKNSYYKYGMMTAVALLTFGILLIINYILHPDSFVPQEMLPYLIFIALNIGAFMIGKSKSSKLIAIFAAIAILFLVLAMLTDGRITLWLLLGTGLFNSVMWANIFSAAIAGLGKYTAQGSSLLVMAILGGAILPFLQGVVADSLGGYHYSYFIPVLAYLYLIVFGISTSIGERIGNTASKN